MFPHGGSANHGCEAIVRTTANMLDGNKALLFSDRIDEDKKYLDDDIVRIKTPRREIKKGSLAYWKAFANARVLHDAETFDKLHFSPVIEACDKDTVLLSIGGDNYCYGENEHIYLVNREARKHEAITILWGCSVEPDSISDKMTDDLQKYDLIVARESLSYETLKQINPHTVHCPDPAFTLPTAQGVYPAGLMNKPYIGINVSPLIQKYETISGITLSNYREMIRHILSEGKYNIALIPHVVWTDNDDRSPLMQLYNEFSSSGRVYMIEDQNCMQLKDIISKSELFIGARTHATIAAYSSCVPTLVVGYSVKARGIARDLFGCEDQYVVPVQKFRQNTDLLDAYKWLDEKSGEIRKHLEIIIPSYIANASRAGTILKGLIK